jgi:hypothetical protein
MPSLTGGNERLKKGHSILLVKLTSLPGDTLVEQVCGVRYLRLRLRTRSLRCSGFAIYSW